jgi:hypothetical protein
MIANPSAEHRAYPSLSQRTDYLPSGVLNRVSGLEITSEHSGNLNGVVAKVCDTSGGECCCPKSRKWCQSGAHKGVRGDFLWFPSFANSAHVNSLH